MHSDPTLAEARRSYTSKTLRKQIGEVLRDVSNLDEDRILRQFLDVLETTLHTNYFRSPPGMAYSHEKGQPKPYLSFRFDSTRVPDPPESKPMFEIWIYLPRMGGVYLRGGKAARSGLRWSDRREDFRTEVLGLVKA